MKWVFNQEDLEELIDIIEYLSDSSVELGRAMGSRESFTGDFVAKPKRKIRHAKKMLKDFINSKGAKYDKKN